MKPQRLLIRRFSAWRKYTVLRVDHPDIIDFIQSKRFEGVLTNFNISIGITNAFMHAVEKNQDFH